MSRTHKTRSRHVAADLKSSNQTRTGTKYFVALSRVSSREQEREGFSLDVQEEALTSYAKREGGEILKLYRVAETATRRDERKTFKQLISYVRQNARKLDGVLFYKVDRAVRNMYDWVELERLEEDYDVKMIYVSQPTENTPSGRMMRRTLANMASFYTDQQSVDVCEGIKRRVESGLFAGKAPYGYKNFHVDGRSLIAIHEEQADNVKRIFDLYGYQGHTLDSIVDQLDRENRPYSKSTRRFGRTKIHDILTSRAYIGEVFYRDNWYPGTHEPLVAYPTFEKVQRILDAGKYRSHQLTFGSELVRCGHCGSAITGEHKIKQTQSGPRSYIYYRCSKYNQKGHPKHRATERSFEEAIMLNFDRIRITDDQARNWFRTALQAKSGAVKHDNKTRLARIDKQLTEVESKQERLLELRIQNEIDGGVFARKQTEYRDAAASLKHERKTLTRDTDDQVMSALNMFELSQSFKVKWLTAELSQKRQILDITGLNYTMDDVSLCYQIRKPFDVLAKGLKINKSRSDTI